jgi:HlyD family secretion protein
MKKTLWILGTLVAGFLAVEVGVARSHLSVAAAPSARAEHGKLSAAASEAEGSGAPELAVETSASSPSAASSAAAASPAVRTAHPDDGKVSALAYLEPEGRLIALGVPAEMAQERVLRWRVREGAAVRRGQTLVEMEALDRLTRDVDVAVSHVEVASSHLEQVLAGARRGERQAQHHEIERIERDRSGVLAAQEAVIDRAKSDLRFQKAEYARYQQLFKDGAAPASLLDQKRLALETSEANLAQAQAERDRQARVLTVQQAQATSTLERIAEVRPTDVAAARADVRAAQAELARARTLRERAFVRAPQDGVVLKVLTRAGERVAAAGLAQLGRTQTMVAVAEVYDSQISRVRLGQQVRLDGRNLHGERMHGTVTEIGKVVQKQATFSNEPGENFDRRIVEVRVRLDAASSRRVAGLSNLQLEAVFE